NTGGDREVERGRAARRRTGQARGEQPGDGEEPEHENRIHAPYVRARLTPAQGQAAHPRCDEHKRTPAAESKTVGKSRSFAPAAWSSPPVPLSTMWSSPPVPLSTMWRGGTTDGLRFPSPEGRGDQRGEDRGSRRVLGLKAHSRPGEGESPRSRDSAAPIAIAPVPAACAPSRSRCRPAPVACS